MQELPGDDEQVVEPETKEFTCRNQHLFSLVVERCLEVVAGVGAVIDIIVVPPPTYHHVTDTKALRQRRIGNVSGSRLELSANLRACSVLFMKLDLHGNAPG